MENLTPPPPRRSVKRARTPEELSDGEVTDRPIARKKQRVSAAAPEKEKSKRVASREYSPPAWVRLTNEPAKKRAATPKAAPKKRAATTKPAANQSGSRAPSVVIKRERSPTDDLYGASPKPELEKRRAERAKAANEGDAGPSTGPKKRTAAKAAPAKTGVDPEKSAKMREVWAKRKAEGRSGRHGGPPKESTVKKQSAKKGGK